MSHPDTCWRVAAIHRCCRRYNKGREWAHEQLSKLVTKAANNRNVTNLADIWFRENGAGVSYMDRSREAYQRGESYP